LAPDTKGSLSPLNLRNNENFLQTALPKYRLDLEWVESFLL